MAKLLTIIILSAIMPSYAIAIDITKPIDKVIDTSWMKQATLKYGFIGSYCASQALTGLTEGYHWTRHSNYGGSYLVNSGNYHAYETARRASWMITGFFAYANYRDSDLSKIGKLRLLVGTALIGRDLMEWDYKYQRYGNPFDYSPEHNRCAMMYFGFRGGKLTDISIGTGNFTGPLVDIGCLVIGKLLIP